MGELDRDIEIFLEVQRTVNMGVFDNWFTEEARSKRNPTQEEAHYSQERKLEELARTDFSSVWAGVSPEYGGMRDGDVPHWYAQEYYALQQKETKTTAILANSQVKLSYLPQSDFITLQFKNGTTANIARTDIAQLVAILSPMAVTHAATNPAYDLNNETSNNTLDPIQKERMLRNLKTMSDWAKASSKAYPKSK